MSRFYIMISNIDIVADPSMTELSSSSPITLKMIRVTYMLAKICVRQ